MSSNREETYFDSNDFEWYRESGAPVWPARLRMKARFGYDPEREVADILSKLKSLQNETDPTTGEATSAADKDLKAQQALGLAGNLVAIVAGWAIDHYAGLVKDGLRPVGWVPHALRDKFSGQIASGNQHDHERRGGHPDFRLNEVEARNLLRVMLERNPGAFPEGLKATACHELDRIEIGEPSPMFQVRPNSKKKGYQSVLLEAWASTMVVFRMEFNHLSWEEATQAVADKFGKSFDTIKGWEANAKRKFGNLQIEMLKDRARHAARAELAEREAALAKDPLARPGIYASAFDDGALADLVSEYNASLRE
jgi:hypothetical protein